MFKRKNRKGFTIVELVIVIAVIGILAAILIPTFVSLNNKANDASDRTLIHNLNTALRIEEAQEGKNKTLHDAVEDLDDYGYKLANLVSKSGENLLWDQELDEFVVNKGEEDYNKSKYWEIRSNMPDPNTNKRSIYAGNGWTTENVGITNGSGFDAGTNSVSSINYSRAYGETDGTDSHDVVIRTNGGTLTINAPQDEVTHFGSADYVDIIAVKPASYEENGTVSLVKVAKGNVALTSDAKVGQIHLAKTGNEFTQIKITLETGAKLPDLSRDSVGTSIGETPVLVCEVASVGTSEFYWLSGNGTIEDEKVLVSTSANGEKTAATAENSTAVAIANAKTGEEVTDTGISVNTAEEIAEVTAQGAAKTFAEIGSKEELIAFRDAWNAGKLAGGTFKLTANIDISGEDWYPIGTWEYPFNGTFDGNNKTINGLYANSFDAEHIATYANNSNVGFGETFGFFGIVGGGDTTVKNVTFANVNIYIYNGKNVGAVIGYAPSNSKFQASSKTTGSDSMVNIEPYKSSTTFVGKWDTNTEIGKHAITLSGVTVNGSVEGSSHIASLVGKMYSSGDLVLINCSNNASVTSVGSYCGGLVAYSTTTTTFTSCTNTGAVHSGSGSVGGLLGRTGSFAVTFDTCTNTGNIESTNSDSYVGGLVGYSNGNAVLTFKKCNNSGNITGTRSGGFFGGTDNATTRVCFIETAVNSGTITGSFASNFIGNLSGACDWETGTSYDTNYVGNNPNVAISCIKHSGVVFTTVDANKLVATNGKIAKYWIISSAHGAIVNNLESETFETTYDATCVNNSKF